MPRYFFDISNGKPHKDQVGEDCQDAREAWQVSKRLMRDVEDTLEPGARWTLEVTDREGRPLYSIQVITQKLRSD